MTERVEELLDRYLDLRLGGAEVEIEGLLAEHPELEAGERERLRRLAELLGKQGSGRTRETGPGPPALVEVGPYRILRELGRGGQGAVFLAEDTRFARRVALKVLSRGGLELDDQHDSARRLKREAEVVSRLHHPGICVVYEMGAEGDARYIAMRYVDGETLARKIAAARGGREPFSRSPVRHERRLELPGGSDGAAEGTPPSSGRRSIERILALAEQCARALHVAHEAGVVHRDVKPGNIMVTPEGEPVLLDFGLARDLEQGTATLTASGGLLGTPAYMSPEQLSSGRGHVDRRADVYALGVTLYECLTLVRPFEAPTRELLYRRILTEEPSPAGRINASVPRDLEVVLATALEKDADHRYQTALDFAEDLRRLREHEPIRARPAGVVLRFTRWMQRNPVLAAALGGVFLALAAGLAVALDLLGRERASLAKSEGNRLIAESGAVLSANPCLALLLGIEGARSAPGKSANNALLKSIGALREHSMVVAHHGSILTACTSQDGRLLVTASQDGTAQVWDVDTLAPIRVLEGHTGELNGVAFSRDGRLLATAGSDGTCRVWSTATWKTLHLLRDSYPLVAVHGFDPTGRLLLTSSAEIGTGGSSVRIWDVEQETSRDIAPGGAQLQNLAFSPDGRLILLAGARGARVLNVGDEARPALEVDAPPANQHVRAMFSPDGQRVLVVFEQGGSSLWDVGTGARLVLDARETDLGAQAFRADGRRVLIGQHGRAAIWDAASGKRACELEGLRRPNVSTFASFSSDGGRVLVAFDQDAGIWDAETGEELARFLGHADTIVGACFSRSGLGVVTSSNDGTLREWGLESMDQRTTFHSDQGNYLFACFDPEGTHITAVTGMMWLDVIDLASSRKSFSLQLSRPDEGRMLYGLAFAPDRRSLLTTEDREKSPYRNATCSWSVESGARLARFEHPDGVRVYDAQFSPDGKRVVTAADDHVARIFDARTGDRELELVGHTGGVRAASFECAGTRVITTSEQREDASIRIWDALTGSPLAVLRAPGERPLCAHLSPDGRMAVAGCWSGKICLWDVSSGELRTRQAHAAVVRSVSFSPDGRQILSAASYPGVKLSEVETLEESMTLAESPAHGASFSADGRWVVASMLDGPVRTWLVDLLQRARELAPRGLTPEERQRYGLSPEEKP